jgi:hypothetical protein
LTPLFSVLSDQKIRSAIKKMVNPSQTLILVVGRHHPYCVKALEAE